jgi:hypothetical protein
MPGSPGRVKQVQGRAHQDLRDEERRKKKSFNRLTTEETKSHQSQRGASAEHGCQRCRKQANQRLTRNKAVTKA